MECWDKENRVDTELEVRLAQKFSEKEKKGAVSSSFKLKTIIILGIPVGLRKVIHRYSAK